jgi:hypothetical protein
MKNLLVLFALLISFSASAQRKKKSLSTAPAPVAAPIITAVDPLPANSFTNFNVVITGVSEQGDLDPWNGIVVNFDDVPGASSYQMLTQRADSVCNLTTLPGYRFIDGKCYGGVQNIGGYYAISGGRYYVPFQSTPAGTVWTFIIEAESYVGGVVSRSFSYPFSYTQQH